MSEKFYCKLCGRSYPSLRALTSGLCNKNSKEGRYHELYRGGEKAKYVCIHCARSYPSLQALTNGLCNKNSNGRYHEPV